MGETRTFQIVTRVIIPIAGISIAAFLALTAGEHVWPFPPAVNGLALPYQGNWNGQVQIPDTGMGFGFTLSLGSGGVHQRVGSISSSDAGCSEAVFLAADNDPITLDLAASASCPFGGISAIISLINDNSLQFTVEVAGMTATTDLSK